METQYTREYLSTRTPQQLKEICGQRRIRGYTGKNKNELIYLILLNQIAQERRVRNRFNIFGMFKSYILRFCDSGEKTLDTHPEFIDEISKTEDEHCVICFDNKRIFAGKCGHLCLCGICSKNIYEQKEALCPICRNEWKEVRMIFL